MAHAFVPAGLLAALLASGCAREERPAVPPRRDPTPAPGEAPAWQRLPAGVLPAADVRETPPVLAAAPRREALAALPGAEPDAPASSPGEPELPPADDALRPPIPRGEVTVHWPAGTPARAVVELDVRVDEAGEVTDAMWAAGEADSARVAAAIEAALAQRFFPAQQRGRAVAAWCRQRFSRGAGIAP